ncbi:MAG TPA: 4-hydroxy-tetrahydrodipicolinate synthase [Ignavibacteriaceae bacterium]|nr:4-hydroxy-tetrahydrodipicolinate synthase [Ignavibacteriaceae bacterium]
MFQGTATALITPFDDELNVDYSAWKKFLKFQIDNGIDALIVLGTTGEAATINNDERKKLTEIAVETAGKKIPVIVGTGTNDTKKVVSLNKLAEECRADGVLIVNPYYNKGTQNSLIDHYKFIAERTPLPIILYNVPSRTAMNMLPETVIKIHESCANVIGIKEACGDISQIAKLFSIKPDNFIVYSGNDDQTLPIIALGGKGLVSVLSNVYPKQTVELTHSLLNDDYKKARKINNRFLKYMNLLFAEANPIPVKYAASRLGYCRNTVRLPLAKASGNTMMLLDEEMEKLKG